MPELRASSLTHQISISAFSAFGFGTPADKMKCGEEFERDLTT